MSPTAPPPPSRPGAPKDPIEAGLEAGLKDTLKAHAKEGLKDALKSQAKDALKEAARADPQALLRRLDGLSLAQRDLLMRRLARLKSGEDATPARDRLRREPRGDDPVPLSFAQERLWFLDRLVPRDPAFTITGALRLRGDLSRPALAAALDAVVARHETLRAAFSPVDGRPVQRFRPPEPVLVRELDLSALAPEAREARRAAIYAEEATTGFDLEHDPLLRVLLVRLDPRDHLLLISMHHIASDGWSLGRFGAEIAAGYAAFVEGRPPSPPELPVRYGDFAAWQRRRAEDGGLAADLAWWKEQLRDRPPLLEVAHDGPGAETDGARRIGRLATLRLEPGLRRALERLSREADATLFATLLCAFLIVLARWTERDDLVVGTPVSGRTRVETEGLIGLFLNNLTLRVRLGPALRGDGEGAPGSFRDALAATREAVLGALAHAEVPFERVVQELAPERSPAQHPFFEIFFNYTPRPIRRLPLPGLEAIFEPPPADIARYPLELYVLEGSGIGGDDGLDLELLYQAGLYTPARMEALLRQMRGVLEQAVADPGRPVAALDLALGEGPDPRRPLAHPPQPSVPRRIAAIIQHFPDAVALVQGDHRLSYAELGACVVALAVRLRAAGMRRGDVVAVSGPRSPGVVVGMVGVLAAGGILLTLSPDLPAERRRSMVERARARYLVAVGELHEPAATEAADALESLVRVDLARHPRPETSADLADWLDHDGAPTEVGRDPAYLFFTSGSTGVPKAVRGAHDGLAHFLAWQRDTYGIGPGHRCAQLVGLSFDVVLRDVLTPLTSGATLVIPEGLDAQGERGGHRPPDAIGGPALVRWLSAQAITHLHAVPSLLATWLPAPAGLDLPALQRIFSAGEPLSATLVSRFQASFPTVRFTNLYGPTETTLARCAFDVPAPPLPGIQPLGRPIPDTQALVLRPDGQPCGVGEPGQVVIRTPFRSLGYLDPSAEDAARFAPNPWRADPDDLLYFTGDRAVRGADGLLEYRGRMDHQVKIGGVRIEPAEVAAVLLQAPGVREAAVVMREDAPGGPGLVAYVVAERPELATAEVLRDFLTPRLLAPMIPGAFVALDALPLNANHKLDRARLPAPGLVQAAPRPDHVPPRNAWERALVRVWEDVLGVAPIGVTASFFELGGHSLLALNLLAAIERDLGWILPLGALFEEPTVAYLARIAEREASVAGSPGSPASPASPDPSSPADPARPEGAGLVVPLARGAGTPIWLVHPGGGMLWSYLPLARHLGPRPILGIQARGLDGRAAPHDELVAMARDYLVALRAEQPDGPYVLVGHSLGGIVAYEMGRQLVAAGENVALVALIDADLNPTVSLEIARKSKEDPPPLGGGGGEAGGGVAPGVEARPRALTAGDDTDRLLEMVRAIEGFSGRAVDLDASSLRALAPEAQVAAVQRALAALEGLPFAADPGLVATLLRVGRAHLAARRGYRPAPSAAPLWLFRASAADDLGWSAHAGHPVPVWRAEGDHLTMLHEPRVAGLGGALRAAIEAALAGALRPGEAS